MASPQRTLGMRSVRILLACFRVVFVFTYVPVYLFVDFMFHLTLPFLKIYFNIFLQITSGEVFTARKRSLRRFCFTPVCDSVNRGGVHGCWGGMCDCQVGMYGCQGGVRGCWRGDVHGYQGACVVAGGVRVVGGVRGCGGACMVVGGGGKCVAYDEIRSMSGRYASYWNAFLLIYHFSKSLPFFHLVIRKCTVASRIIFT